ncbi:Uncharacterized protein Rs2_45586 [Raphanus sativus]|nr:Uncharacterized protein Rs2_45586 [Raphanus sativus]
MSAPTQDARSESAGVKSYASLLQESATLEELGTPAEHVSGAPFVFIPDDNIAAAKEEFRDFIFARFHGDFPPMGRIIGVVNAIWAKTGPRIFVHHVGPGEFLLKVTNIKTREVLLGRTCWNIAGYPMFVAPWSPEFNPEDVPLTDAVVPVELRGVPYLLFNKESLSRLATAVGKPVSLAPETERKENFQVAKLYVRVDLTKKLPSNIISGFSNGREVDISVSYPWMPMMCDACGKYGHLRAKCKVLTPGQERQKQRSVSPAAQRSKTRQKSRQGRRKSVRPLPPSLKENASGSSTVVADDLAQNSTLEEGEIDPGIPTACSDGGLSVECANDKASVQLDTNSVGDTVGSVDVRSDDVATAKEVPGASGSMILQGNSDSAGSTVVVTYGTTDSCVSADAEDPFFLVNRRRCGRKRPLFGAFLETHIQENNVNRILNAIPAGWRFFGNYSHHDSGRIIVVWDPSVSVFVYSVSAQAVTCERQPLWDEIINIQVLVDTSGIDDMNVMLQEAELFEAQAKGVPFTWWNNNEADPISKRIDHALINQHWASSFPDSFADFLQPGHSDHSPCIFKIPSIRRRGRKPFKFYHHVIDHPEFTSTVADAWAGAEVVGTNQYKLVRRMKLLKPVLRDLNKRHFSGISGRVKQQTVVVEGLQRALLTQPDGSTAFEEHRERAKLNILLNAEQKFYRQRSRVRWADVGDRNTPFYHKTVAQRNAANHIHYLIDESDHLLGGIEDIKSHSSAYFQSILGQTDMPSSPVSVDILQDLLTFRCSDLQHAYLKREAVMSGFKEWTGLDMNDVKSEIFFGGFTNTEAAVISDISGFKIGTFPTRYLGLPLNPKKITFATLQPFLERLSRKEGLVLEDWRSSKQSLSLKEYGLSSLSQDQFGWLGSRVMYLLAKVSGLLQKTPVDSPLR